MAGYTHRTWTCPFFKWDEKYKVHCEGARLVFPDKETEWEYTGSYCAGKNGWKNCSVAESLLKYYDRGDARAGR